jgi:hypothetical protein
MSSEKSPEVLQFMLQYYRSKCSQLEHEFLLYKFETETRLKRIESDISKTKK